MKDFMTITELVDGVTATRFHNSADEAVGYAKSSARHPANSQFTKQILVYRRRVNDWIQTRVVKP